MSERIFSMMTQPHVLDASILREYDIRGKVNITLREIDCYYVGRAFGTLLKRRGLKTAALGFDGRETSPLFSAAVARGLNDSGIDVENVGLGPTPMVYFAMVSRKKDAAVIVTGSHSPLSDNGIKMAYCDGPFYGDAVQGIGRLCAGADFESGQGCTTEHDIRDAYVARLVQEWRGPRPLKVAWDCGNGAAGEITRRLTALLPGEHILLYDDIDGRFPNHHPDPTVEKNMRDLATTVRTHGCDVGIGFDGDADRIGAVDAQGRFIAADLLMAVYAAEVLRDLPGATIIGDVKCSRVFFDEVTRLGGRPVMWNTGHSLIKAKAKVEKAPLAGELAGHICFSDRHDGFDDAPYCAVRLLNLISESAQGLAGLTAHLPEMQNTPEVRFAVPAARKFLIAPEIKARLQKINQPDATLTDIDGVRVTTPDGWWLIRSSNTEDLLTVRAEGFTAEGLARLTAQLEEQLALSDIASPFRAAA